MLARRTVAVLVALCSVAVAVVATPGSAYLELAALPTLDCKIVNTPTNITIKVINKCGGNVNIRTCPLKFDHCVGYPKEPNYYQDCTQRIASGATEDLVLDTQVSLRRCASHCATVVCCNFARAC